jgi:hypothetical protein
MAATDMLLVKPLRQCAKWRSGVAQRKSLAGFGF